MIAKYLSLVKCAFFQIADICALDLKWASILLYIFKICQTVAGIRMITSISLVFKSLNVPFLLLCRHLRSRLEMGVDLGGSTQVARAPVVHTGRSVAPSARQQQRDRRSLPCQVIIVKSP